MRPVRITEEDSSPYELGTPLDMPYADRKIAAPKEGIVMEPITVRTEHLDSNHHVNITKEEDGQIIVQLKKDEQTAYAVVAFQ